MKAHSLLSVGWTVFLVVIGSLLLVLALNRDFSLVDRFSNTRALFLTILLLAFFTEYVDSSLGMGYGTTLTPILMLMGYSPLQIVPAILLSEFATGVSSGLYHHKVGNVDFGRGTDARKTMLILAACSIAGTLIAVTLAVTLPKSVITTYIGIMIIGIGVYILLSRQTSHGTSMRRIIGLGSVAAFNKGISGGGYGPLVTGGQILAGVPEKNAVGITSMAEGLVCIVGLVLYQILNPGLAFGLAFPLVLGAILSVPAAVWTVKLLPGRWLRKAIGYATLYLGTLTLIRIML